MLTNNELSDTDKNVIEQSKSWIEQIVIGLNFCPFAKKVFDNNTIFYHVDNLEKTEDKLHTLADVCRLMDGNTAIETAFILYNSGLEGFDDYLDFLELANQLLVVQGYEGIYQLASFHPQYCFEGAEPTAAENYTNRSPYPMLHLLRESSLQTALESYKQPEKIPQKNIEVATNKGADFFVNTLKKIKSEKC